MLMGYRTICRPLETYGGLMIFEGVGKFLLGDFQIFPALSPLSFLSALSPLH